MLTTVLAALVLAFSAVGAGADGDAPDGFNISVRCDDPAAATGFVEYVVSPDDGGTIDEPMTWRKRPGSPLVNAWRIRPSQYGGTVVTSAACRYELADRPGLSLP